MIQLLPSPPTDNVYKLMAISGLWLLAGLIAALLALKYLGYSIEKSAQEFQANEHIKSLITKTEAKIALLPKCETDDIEKCAESKNKGAMLNKVLSNHKKALTPDEKPEGTVFLHPDNPIIDFILKSNYLVYFVVTVYGLLTLVLTGFGFHYWSTRVQAPSEYLTKLDIQIKKATLLKLQIEIAQMQPMSETVKKLFELRGIMQPPE